MHIIHVNKPPKCIQTGPMKKEDKMVARTEKEKFRK